jgi:cytolysin-activating lysine-acyltransferase
VGHLLTERLAYRASKPNLRDAAETRGHIAFLMTQHPLYQEFPLACLTAWIETPIDIDQIKVFFNPDTGLPVGYVTWAWLAPDVEQRWLTDPDATLHFSEWNEGDRLWIMDLVAPFGHAYDIVRYMKREMFPGATQAHSLRRDQDGLLRRRSVWRRTA